MKKTYRELMTIPTFEERLEYLRTYSTVGEDTFGANRYLNQTFYRSREWRNARNYVIARDLACDLAIPGMDLLDGIVIHHINPISVEDFGVDSDALLNPENLITTSEFTHRLIHYGDSSSRTIEVPVERFRNDTAPWKL